MSASELLEKRQKKFEQLLLKNKNTDLIIAYVDLKKSISETMQSALNTITSMSKKNKHQIRKV